MINNESELRSKIYTIRGVQVMLDSDLAEIYGYETKRFNEQVKNNIEKFDEDFRFQLTKEEYQEILRSKISTLDQNLRSKILTLEPGKYSKYLPYAFTEQGIHWVHIFKLYVLGGAVQIGIEGEVMRGQAICRDPIHNSCPHRRG